MTPRPSRLLLFALALPLLGLALAGCLRSVTSPEEEATAGDYLFCFWNVENLYDDKLDGWKTEPDKDFDAWFHRDAKARELKYDHLSKALLEMNNGRGPDILAIVEVESRRAAELLRDALNARLKDPALHYKHVVMKELRAGRNIAPAIITRLKVDGDRIRMLGQKKRQRTLQAHLDANGHDLVVVVSHWTSRIREGTERQRADYADVIYGEFRAMYTANPSVDFLVCGDFNDTPNDESMTRHLHALGDVAAVRRGGSPPLMLDLLAGKDPKEYGTHYHRKWMIFDQIVVSPGMLDDRGWSCEVDSLKVDRSLYRPGDKLRRPWAFGREKDEGPRGYSDHFPVTVKLRVQGR